MQKKKERKNGKKKVVKGPKQKVADYVWLVCVRL